MTQDIEAVNALVKEKSWFVSVLQQEIGKVIVGQTRLVDQLLIGLLCNGHLLIEGVPGLAKTLAVRTLARAIHASFQRIQFTPDLLPADLIGTLVFNPQSGIFTTRKGPLFANFILADEINRAPAKVQSALLEAMQEHQVTIGDTTYPLDDPFMVLATQNPIEQEGTYHLPEAQVDRFMFKVLVDYPSRKEERLIMELMMDEELPLVKPVVTLETIREARKAARAVHLEDSLKEYIVHLVFSTREPANYRLDGVQQLIAYGASPRATIYLALTAKAHAFLDGRGYVTPEDIKSVAMDVLRHRIIVTYEAEAEEISAEEVITRVLRAVEVP
ncbi:MAG TPA: MoxR family ATPase [Dehalococcoidia bacterium]|nr:MoxR family ATPase [Dehalococcoidia bacterium]